MKNKYPGDCADCGQRVLVGQGTAFKVGKRWAVKHGDCHDTAQAPAERQLSFKQLYGRCEDAPCCGCCGGGQEFYVPDYSDPF